MQKDDQGQMQLLKELANEKGPANMWEIGSRLGWDRQTTEDLATDLMARSLLAIANLSGGVRVTEEGMSCLAQLDGSGVQAGAAESIGSWLEALEAAGDVGLSSAAKEDLLVDISTMKAQLKRKRPLSGVLAALLTAMQAALDTAENPRAKELFDRSKALIGSL